MTDNDPNLDPKTTNPCTARICTVAEKQAALEGALRDPNTIVLFDVGGNHFMSVQPIGSTQDSTEQQFAEPGARSEDSHGFSMQVNLQVKTPSPEVRRKPTAANTQIAAIEAQFATAEEVRVAAEEFS